MTPIVLLLPPASVRDRLLSVETIQRRSLERLYKRRKTVENLIHSLEEYQRVEAGRANSLVELSEQRKCS